MVFSSSIIEEWLLSGKAVYKNLSCGNAGLVQIPVPEGKTYIITKITILPFANIMAEDGSIAGLGTFYANKIGQDLREIIKRNQYQLLFYNDRINNSWNIRSSFAINVGLDSVVGGLTSPSAYYEKQEIDCFMVVETNSWLYLKYIDFNTNIPSLSQDNFTNIFNGSQNWNPSDFGYTNQDDIAEFVSPSGPTFSYVPQGYNTNYGNPDLNSDQFTLVSTDTLLDPLQNPSYIPPFALGTSSTNPIDIDSINSLPLYNIEYIEVNRRLGTNGLL